jgi:hypothetical protein
MSNLRFTRAPRTIRRPGVALDNVAVVPASLLPFKQQWQAVANGMPKGSVLLCSTTNRRQRRILQQVSTHRQAKGHRVRTLPAEDFTPQPYSDLGADYFDTLDTERVQRHHVHRLEQLGYAVTLTPKEAA